MASDSVTVGRRGPGAVEHSQVPIGRLVVTILRV